MGTPEGQGTHLSRASIIALLVDLHEPRALRAFLSRHGYSPQKSLGQHFLCSKRVSRAIAIALHGMKGALEIGPGPGALTSKLCEVCESVEAIELDARAESALSESAPCAKVTLGDALSVDWAEILERLPRPRAIVSNLPYLITGPLLGRVEDHALRIDLALLMMQAEVADRVRAAAGDSARGALSVTMQCLFCIEKVVEAPPGCFVPPPKVQSAVLKLTPRKHVDWVRAAEIKRLSHLGFRQPRKTLLNNLSLQYSKLVVAEAIDEVKLAASVRPHQLELEHWELLVRRLSGL